MRDKCVEIIDVNEKFESGIVFNFGKIVDKIGTYRKDLIARFNDNFEKFIDKNQFFFDRLYDVECMIDDKFDYIVDKSIDRVSGVVSVQSQAEKRDDQPSYKLQPMGYYDDYDDEDDIFEFKEFKLEDYDTDEYKVIRRSR